MCVHVCRWNVRCPCTGFPSAEPFYQPVNLSLYPDYLTKVGGRLMDLSTIWKKLTGDNETGYQYDSLQSFRADMTLIVENCEAFCKDRFPGLPPV